MLNKMLYSLVMFYIVILGFAIYESIPKSGVYACSSDKDSLPVDVEKLCKRLTKGQWWHK